jgi:hypothetical protein
LVINLRQRGFIERERSADALRVAGVQLHYQQLSCDPSDVERPISGVLHGDVLETTARQV